MMRSLLDRKCNAEYAGGLLRALLGAMVFALPLLMTMEMWELGASMDRLRLALLLLVTLPMLVALSFYAGFERTFSITDNILDALCGASGFGDRVRHRAGSLRRDRAGHCVA
jgi:uncharacterized membrane protein